MKQTRAHDKLKAVKEAQEWAEQTRKLHGHIAGFFKPKENEIIVDFISTAAGWWREEGKP